MAAEQTAKTSFGASESRVWRAVRGDKQSTPCGHKHKTREAAKKCGGRSWKWTAFRVQSRAVPLGNWGTEYYWP